MKRTMLLCVLLSGCAVAPPITLPQAESNCGQVEFREFGKCIRQQFDTQYPGWQGNHEADLAELYVAWLEAAGTRVANGTMAEDEARLGSKMLRVRLYEIVAQRRSQSAAYQQQAMSNLLTGLALLNAAQPQPGPMITCNTYYYGNNATTTCQ